MGDGRPAGHHHAAVAEGQQVVHDAAVAAGLVVEGDELAAFDEGRGARAGGGGVVLGRDEEPLAARDAVVHDRGDVDDPGVFFVDGLEQGRARGEAAAVRFEDLHGVGLAQGLRGEGRVHDPVLGDVRAVARVLLDVDQAVVADRQVVEAAGRGAVAAGEVLRVDDDPDVAAGGEDAVGGVAVEVELVDLGGDRDVVHRASAGAGGGEDQGVVVEPMGVLRSGELGHAGGRRGGLEFCAGLGGDGGVGENRGEGEGAVDARGVLEGDGARVSDGRARLHAVDLAVRETRAFDGVAAVGLGADVDVDFARGGVVRADHDGLEEVGRSRGRAVVRPGQQVLIGVFAMVGQLVDLARVRAAHDPGERLALRAGLLAVEEDAAVVASSGSGVVEGAQRRKVGGAGAEVGVRGGRRGPGGAVPHHLVGPGSQEVAPGDDLPGRGVDHPLGDEAAGGAVRPGGTQQRRVGGADGADLMVGEEGQGAVAVAEGAEPVGDAGHLVATDRVADRQDRGRGPARRGGREVGGLAAGRAGDQALGGQRDRGGRGEEERACDVFHGRRWAG